MPDLGGVEVLEILVESLKTWLMWNEWAPRDAKRLIAEAAEKAGAGLEFVKHQRDSYRALKRLPGAEKRSYGPRVGDDGTLVLIPDPPSTPGEEVQDG